MMNPSSATAWFVEKGIDPVLGWDMIEMTGDEPFTDPLSPEYLHNMVIEVIQSDLLSYSDFPPDSTDARHYLDEARLLINSYRPHLNVGEKQTILHPEWYTIPITLFPAIRNDLFPGEY